MDLMKVNEDRVKEVERILDVLGLDRDHLYYVMYDNPSRDLPYHNSQHLLTVAKNCYEGGVVEGLDNTILRLLVLAGLYHDWDHSGDSTVNDIVNIKRSIVGLRKCMRVERWNAYIDFEKDEKTVASLILATQTPVPNYFKPERAPLPYKIIRDADSLQVTEPDTALWVYGLEEELHKYGGIDASVDFIMRHHFYTNWGLSRSIGWVRAFLAGGMDSGWDVGLI